MTMPLLLSFLPQGQIPKVRPAALFHQLSASILAPFWDEMECFSSHGLTAIFLFLTLMLFYSNHIFLHI